VERQLQEALSCPPFWHGQLYSTLLQVTYLPQIETQIYRCRGPGQGDILGLFAKLRKATVSFVMPVCLYVRMEQLCSHWTDFYEMSYLSIYRKAIEKIQVLLKPDKNNWYFA
jgi:hypothetical protein